MRWLLMKEIEESGLQRMPGVTSETWSF